MNTALVSLRDIKNARERIRNVVQHTPLIPYRTSQPDELVYFKPENLQSIGSFKIRGAYNRIASLHDEVRQRGVIAYSSGNHAQGVAYSANQLGIQAVIVMPDNAPKIKIEATRKLGAQIILYDPKTQRREDVAAEFMRGKALTLIPPFNDNDVIAGQGTIGLEILDDFPEVEMIIAPVGGGGLISGIGAAVKNQKPSVKIIGVEPAVANDAQLSLQTGKIVELSSAQTSKTIADGTRTVRIGEITFEHMKKYVDSIVTVEEADIKKAIQALHSTQKLSIEPSGALPFAAFIFHRDRLPPAKNIVMVLSGGNIDPKMLQDITS